MINLLITQHGAIKPAVYRASTKRSVISKIARSPIARRTKALRAQNNEENNGKLDSNKVLDTSLNQSPQKTEPPSPPPPRRRSPVGRRAEDDEEEEEERDLFIPIITIVALLGYGATALIAWLEYEGIFTF